MDRVKTLLNKFEEQLGRQAPAEELLHTLQMMQGELVQKIQKQSVLPCDHVCVIPPIMVKLKFEETAQKEGVSSAATVVQPEMAKVVETLQVDEQEIENELNEIKEIADRASAASSKVKAQYLFDPIEDVPTLSQQDPVTPVKQTDTSGLSAFEYPESLNDRLKEEKLELSQSLTNAPIKDLKKAIGVNDRFVFINELFRGDEAMYERSIKTIQNFSIYAEAEFWIRRELKTKLGWLDDHAIVKQFNTLVKRRFS